MMAVSLAAGMQFAKPMQFQIGAQPYYMSTPSADVICWTHEAMGQVVSKLASAAPGPASDD